MNNRSIPRPSLTTTTLCGALGLLAAGYISLGLYTLVFDTNFSYPVDLRLRWIEQGRVFQGLNPQELTYPEHLLPEMIIGQRNVRGNYPPWAYATGMVLVPPFDWTVTRVYFAVLNVIAIAALGYWFFRFGGRLGQSWGILAATSVLASFPFCTCLSYGQYSIIVFALLVGCYVALERGYMATAGLLVGIAAIKPQLAGLFFLVPAIYPYPLRKKVRFFAAAGAYLAVASFAASAWVNSTPWDILRGTATEAIKFYRLSGNPLVIWMAALFGFSMGSKLLAVLVAGLCAVLLFAIRGRENLWAGFSVCAILAMYWSYSRHYDLLILGLPLVQLVVLWRTKGPTLAAVAFLALGAMLWLPIRIEMSRWPSVQLATGIVCLLALATIVASEIASRTRIATASSDEPRSYQLRGRSGEPSARIIA